MAEISMPNFPTSSAMTVYRIFKRLAKCYHGGVCCSPISGDEDHATEPVWRMASQSTSTKVTGDSKVRMKRSWSIWQVIFVSDEDSVSCRFVLWLLCFATSVLDSPHVTAFLWSVVPSSSVERSSFPRCRVCTKPSYWSLDSVLEALLLATLQSITV